jgi:hypothetical protein
MLGFLSLAAEVPFYFIYLFFGSTGVLNSGLHACQAGTVLLEPLLPLFALVIFEKESHFMPMPA